MYAPCASCLSQTIMPVNVVHDQIDLNEIQAMQAYQFYTQVALAVFLTGVGYVLHNLFNEF